MGEGLAADGILLIVEGNGNLGGLPEILGGGIPEEEKLHNEEHKVHEGNKLDRPAVPGTLFVFAGPEAEVEANGDQVGDMVGSGVRGGSCCGNDGVHDYQGCGFFSSGGGILKPVGLELLCEALVEPGVCLRVGWFSGVRQTIQEVGRCNRPTCLRNQLSPCWLIWCLKYLA